MTDAPAALLHEDPDLVAVDKPAGLVTAGPDSVHERLSAARSERLYLVHRLDRETSGVLLFARSAESHRYLSGLFERREVEKHYAAVVLGRMDAAEGMVDQPIREFGSGRMGVDPRGKPSQTRWRVLHHLAAGDLLDVQPLTGRRHQIRVHLHAIGHPVLGDPRYGTDRPVGGAERLMLHAASLSFVDRAGVSVVVAASSPERFTSMVRP